MEKKLTSLFDYQKFEKNPKLEKLIGETLGNGFTALDDEEAGLVNAAGLPQYPNQERDDKLLK